MSWVYAIDSLFFSDDVYFFQDSGINNLVSIFFVIICSKLLRFLSLIIKMGKNFMDSYHTRNVCLCFTLDLMN
jgi:hypothetical protein